MRFDTAGRTSTCWVCPSGRISTSPPSRWEPEPRRDAGETTRWLKTDRRRHCSTFLFLFKAFPPVPEEKKPNSRLQERLLKKLGQHAHPFYFTVSPRWAQNGSHCSRERRLTEPAWHHHWFCFSALQIPQNLPCSVTLQPGPEDTGKVHTHTHTNKPEPMTQNQLIPLTRLLFTVGQVVPN